MIERRSFLVGSAAFLTGCSGSSNPPPQPCPPGTVGPGWPNCTALPPPPPSPAPSGEWSIGPVINGVNYSRGVPDHTTDQAFLFPVRPPASNTVGYVTLDPVGPYSLIGKSRIKFAFELVGDGPYKGSVMPEGIPPYVGLYFQRLGDNWSGQGTYEGYRFYTLDSVVLAPGTWTLEVPLSRDKWVSVSANTATEADFRDAISNASAVGFTFGNEEGKGHGAYSESPGCTFKVLGYELS